MNHQQLVDAACAGDASALAQLMTVYRGRLHRYGRVVCSSEADADDAVQEALGALPKRLRAQRPEALTGWLFAVVRNLCRRMLRPTATRARLEHLLSVVERALMPDEQLEQAQLAAAVHRALDSLEPMYREVLVLRDLEGQSGEETARRLELTLEAMKSRLHRARRLLREHLNGADYSFGSTPLQNPAAPNESPVPPKPR